jgi:hypothetical protein
MNSEERREILTMLAEGKITVEEAEMLLDALEETTGEKAGKEKCSEAFLGNIGFGDFGVNFKTAFDEGFGGFFEGFGDFFGKSTKQKHSQRARSNG